MCYVAKLPSGISLSAGQGVRCWRARLGPADMQDAVAEIDLVPAQIDKLGCPGRLPGAVNKCPCLAGDPAGWNAVPT